MTFRDHIGYISSQNELGANWHAQAPGKELALLGFCCLLPFVIKLFALKLDWYWQRVHFLYTEYNFFFPLWVRYDSDHTNTLHVSPDLSHSTEVHQSFCTYHWSQGSRIAWLLETRIEGANGGLFIGRLLFHWRQKCLKSISIWYKQDSVFKASKSPTEIYEVNIWDSYPVYPAYYQIVGHSFSWITELNDFFLTLT